MENPHRFRASGDGVQGVRVETLRFLGHHVVVGVWIGGVWNGHFPEIRLRGRNLQENY